MPYINKADRFDIDEEFDDLVGAIRTLPREKREGILNYTISRLIMQVLKLDDEPSYKKFNAAVGVLECVKLEMYRRAIGPYEDKAIEKNGDIKEYNEDG